MMATAMSARSVVNENGGAGGGPFSEERDLIT
jgi:hypothetical protein